MADTAQTDASFTSGNEDLRSTVGNTLVKGDVIPIAGPGAGDISPEKLAEINRFFDMMNGGYLVLDKGTAQSDALKKWIDTQLADPEVSAYLKNRLVSEFDPSKNQSPYAGEINTYIGSLKDKFATEQGRDPSVIDKVIARNEAGYDELDPANNPGLKRFADASEAFANGSAGVAFGGVDAATAGKNIGQAGLDARRGALNDIESLRQNAGQSARDLGIVRASANGQGPSAAEILGRQLIQGAVRGMGSQAATARGGNIASANRGALAGGQQVLLQGEQAIAAQRAQEQLNAQQLLVQGGSLVGNQYNQAGTLGNAVTTSDIDRSKSKAAALNQTFGVNANLGLGGLTSMGTAQGEYANQMGAKVNAQQAGDQGVMNVLSGVLGTTTGAGASNFSTNTGARTAAAELAFRKKQAADARIDSYAGKAFDFASNAAAAQFPGK
jgi:hypothetical protein